MRSLTMDMRTRGRPGFTLVEMLVALALIVFIMAILSQAFVCATQTFRDLKAAGDLAEKLRTVTTLLKRELAADHFEGKKRLSSPSFWVNGPPEQGFFSIYQGPMPNSATPAGNQIDYITEGIDFNGVPSTSTTSHALHFTVKLRGNDMGDFFTTSCPLSSQLFGPVDARYQVSPNVPLYNYPWAEVAVFLQPSIDPMTGEQNTANGTPLFNLYHRRRLAVLDNTLVQQAGAVAYPPPDPTQLLEISCEQDPANEAATYFNNPSDLTVPLRRFGLNTSSVVMPRGWWGGPTYPTLASQGATTGAMANTDLLLTDVISFEVRVLLDGIPAASLTQPFMTLWDPPVVNAYPTTNSAVANANVRVFDTWSQVNDLALQSAGNFSHWSTLSQPTSIPLCAPEPNLNPPQFGSGPILLAVQITIRIWDRRREQTRQTILVQAM